MSPSGAEYIKPVKAPVDEIDPSAVSEVLGADGVVIVDVRESDEWDAGHIPGAKFVTRGHLESRTQGAAPDPAERVILHCPAGTRSALAAKTLKEQLGYEHVESMTGGYTLWK